MKQKIIETAGKTWRTLGERGETSIPELARTLKEREDIVNQAIGWLAREDKITYATKKNETVVSLIESEMQSFRRSFQKAAPREMAGADKKRKV